LNANNEPRRARVLANGTAAPLAVTTSWDDGDVLDERLAELLDRHGINGTFYLPRDYRTQPLSPAAIRSLGARHEMAAHSLSHPDLRKLSRAEKRREIGGSKEWLENVLGQPVTSFCYPSGYFDKETTEVVGVCGYHVGRTVAQGVIAASSAPLQMATTLHVYPMPFRKTGPHSYNWLRLLTPLRRRMPAFRKLGVPFPAFRSWEALAVATFEIARERGETFHLWGHSWEIDKFDMWRPLARVLEHIGRRPDCSYVTNAELVPRG
jgi:peptidoglycan/xylan/chitin deacetylase (PgdA/CDA1 family)